MRLTQLCTFWVVAVVAAIVPVALAGALPHTATDGNYYFPITADPEKYQTQPAVSGNRVVYSDGWDAVYGIRLYDIATGQYSWVAQGSPTQVLASVSGDIVTWQDDRAGGWLFNTMLYDLANNVEFQVSQGTTPRTDPSSLAPAASDGPLVVYREPTGYRSFDLYLYDLSVDSNHDGVPNYRDPNRPNPDPARRKLVTGGSHLGGPRISGRRIVYPDTRNGNSDIYLYELDLNQEFALCTHFDQQLIPDISGNYVVWADMRSGSGDIYLYDLSVDSDHDGVPNWRENPRPNPDPAERNLTPEPHSQWNPAVSGNLVVWEDQRYGGADGTDILMMDVTTNALTEITHDAWDQAAPRISGNTIVWQDNRYGNWDILACQLVARYEEDDPAISYSGAWKTYTDSRCSGGALTYSAQRWASATFSFSGTGIKWIVAKAPMCGKAKVYLDNVYMGMADLYSAAAQFQVVLEKTGLPSGKHTLFIQVSGQKNPRATGTNVDIDAFEVIP